MLKKKNYLLCLFVFSFTSHLRQFEFFACAETAAFEKLLISILNLIFIADMVASMLMKRDSFGVTAAVCLHQTAAVTELFSLCISFNCVVQMTDTLIHNELLNIITENETESVIISESSSGGIVLFFQWFLRPM